MLHKASEAGLFAEKPNAAASFSQMVKRHARYKLNENMTANKYAGKAVQKK